jgi:chemotaxis protein CheD
MNRVVGIGEWMVSGNPGDTIMTYALASCVAVTAYFHAGPAAGMIHIALPEPMASTDYVTRPAYFAQTGVPLLMEKMAVHFGCRPEELVLGMYGGAESVREEDVFQIGRRNTVAVNQKLRQMGLTPIMRDTGGYQCRTIGLDVATGAVRVQSQPLHI